MLHSRWHYTKIKHLHKRYFQLIYNDKLSFYKDLSTKDRSVSTYRKNIQDLAGEMFKVNPLYVNLTKRSNTLKQFVGCYRRIECV